VRYCNTSDDLALEDMIHLEREVLTLGSAGHPLHSIFCGNLATSLTTRYEHTGDDRLLDEAINLQREALALRPEGHPHRVMACGHLAKSLSTRYERTGDVHLLDEVIDLDRETLALHPEGHPGRSLSCESLTYSLSRRYDRTGDTHLLDQAIDVVRGLLHLCEGVPILASGRAISGADGPKVAKWFYKELLSKEVVDADSVAYALDSAVGKLRGSGVSPDRWAPFIHMGA
jgi:hypothetical protein